MHTFVEHVDFVKHEDKKLAMKTSRFKNDLYVRFLNGKNRINVYFKLYSPHSYQQHYKLTLDYEGINFVVVSPGEEKDQNGRFVKYLDVVICYLKAPLLMFCAITDGDNTKPQRYKHDYKSSAVEDGVGKWMRCLSVPGVDNDSFGRSTVLKLRMPSIKEYQSEAVFDIKTDPLDILSCLSYFAGCPIYWSKVETTSSKPAFDLKPLMKAEMISDQFPVQYALQGIFSVSHYVSDFLTLTVNGEKAGEKCKKFSKLIRTCAFKHPKALEDTLFEAFRVLERTSALDILEFLPKEFDRLCSNPHYPTDPGKGVIMIRRVFITPSRVICAPPERQLASWFLSKLEQDCLIRLYFRDDNMESYTFTCNPQKHNGRDGKSSWKIMLHERVFHPVVNGLTIASKTFEFLVCSSSMLRSHALMMYARDRFGFSAAHYQDEIGDVKQKIKTVAKYIARSGQAISQPIGRVKEEPSRVHFSYPDVIKYDEKTRLKKYTFTDGIGMMSAEVATNAAKAMNWKIVPSALQMRYGGAKGVVAVDPRLPNLPGHPGKHLILRDSMVKFASQSDSLEILKPSLLRPIHLNKSFIMVLDQLGVGEEVFMELLLKQLNMACESFLSEAAALKTLKGYTALHIPLNIKKILDNESMINVLREPFFRKCLGVVTNEMVLELKSKARIKLPLDAGRHMLGVTDESGLLQEGQVFVQYAKFNSTFTSDVKQHEWEILEGEILVTKAPTMVTGDARKFKAVNIPQLHHHRDVVVFAQKGERPDPDKMAGSDLDGDEYAVIWYKPLIFKGPNRDPLDYTCVKEQQDKEINTQSIMKYIMQYMERDSIGLIATTHLARSDRDRDGTDRTNQGLALKYTKALDAVKTGDYQTILPHEKSLIHPDFMGKEAHGPTYVSERVLGTIYRHVCLYEMTVCDYVTVQPLKQANELLVHKDWERFRGSAEGSLQKYSAMIHSLLKQYKVEDEASLLTQSFAAQSNGRELRDYRKTIDMQVREIMKAMRDDFEYQFNDKEEGAEKESMKQAKASAWYVVTQQASLKETDCPVLGLPWIVGEYLADLSLEDPLRRSNPTTIIQEMSDQLDKSLTKDMAQKSLEDRIDEAMKILAKWMEYQGHLQFLSTREQENCLSQVQVVLNEIGLGLPNQSGPGSADSGLPHHPDHDPDGKAGAGEDVSQRVQP